MTLIIIGKDRAVTRSRQHINKIITVALRNEAFDTRIGCSRNKDKLNVPKEEGVFINASGEKRLHNGLVVVRSDLRFIDKDKNVGKAANALRENR